MAKKKNDNMTAAIMADLMQQQQTDQQPETPAPKMTKAAKTASVYMTAEQHTALERIARELDTNKHAVMQIAIRHFIKDYESGTYKPEPLYRKVYY